MKTLLLGLVALSVIASQLAMTSSALAHATPIQYTPDISEVLTQPPQSVRIEFSERPELGLSSITVANPSGAQVNVGSPVVDPKNPRVLEVALHGSDEGPYTVSWQVVSADDGHFSKGGFVFFVGQASGAAFSSAQFSISHTASLIESSVLASELLGESILLGVLILMICIWRPLKKKFKKAFSEAEERIFWHRISNAVLIGCGFTLVGAFGFIVFKLYTLASEFTGSSVVQLLSPFLATKAPQFTIYRAIGVLIFTVAFFVYKKRNAVERSSGYLVLGLILVIVAYLRACISHAATSEFYPQLSILINAIHLLFKELWIGTLAVLIGVLNPIIRKLRGADILAFSSIRFSQIANISIAIAGATGAYIVWLHLKSFENIFTTIWGATFVLLSVIAFLFVAMRVYHQLIVDRQLAKIKEYSAGTQNEILLRLGASLPLELALGILILSITSNLIITTPPLIGDAYAQSVIHQGVAVALSQDRSERNILDINFSGTKEDSITSIEVTAFNSTEGIGDLAIPPVRRFKNAYAISENALQPNGDWRIHVVGHRAHSYDVTVDFVINPMYAKAFSTQRHWNIFSLLSLIAVIALPLVSCVLYLRSKKLITRLSGVDDSYDTVLYTKGMWILAIAIYLILLHVFGSSTHTAHSGFLQSRFQKWCAYNKDTWEENTAMRNGKITGDYVGLGCTFDINSKKYHLLNFDEYMFLKADKKQ